MHMVVVTDLVGLAEYTRDEDRRQVAHRDQESRRQSG